MKLETSEQIGALVAALSKAQAAMAPAARDTANEYYGTKYAPLASIWAVAQGPLTENGLAVLQPTSQSEQGLHVITILAHAESGQWVRGYMPVHAGKGGMQALGSAITYARRYALAAMVGVVTDDDDDGEASEGRGQAQQQGQQRPQQQRDQGRQQNPQQQQQRQSQRQDAPRQQQGGGQHQQSTSRQGSADSRQQRQGQGAPQQQRQTGGQQRQGQQQSGGGKPRHESSTWWKDIESVLESAKAATSSTEVQDLIDQVQGRWPDRQHPVREAVRSPLWKRLQILKKEEARHG